MKAFLHMAIINLTKLSNSGSGFMRLYKILKYKETTSWKNLQKKNLINTGIYINIKYICYYNVYNIEIFFTKFFYIL